MSTAQDAEQTIAIMRAYCEEHGDNDLKSLSIADAFACLGGNTFSFYVNFQNVVAYEKDKTRCTSLKEIVQNYVGNQNNRVEVREGDCELGDGGIMRTPYDVIFLDPPWATPGTKVVGAYVFTEAARLCEEIARNKTARYIFLKLPLEEKFPDAFGGLRAEMSVEWTDIETKLIMRKRGPSYSIVCAKNK